MKNDNLFTILTCVGFLLVECLGEKPAHGNETTDSSDRIYGGQIANVEEFRYAVQLVYVDNGGSICSGSIVSPHCVITAAHCLANKRCEGIKVFAAGWTPDREFNSINCYPHENFMATSFDYDIGILRTVESLVEDGRAIIIPLAQPGTTHPPGEHVIIAGFGLTELGTFPHYLLRADVVIYDWKYCNDEYQKSYECIDDMQCPPPEIPKHSICTKGIGPLPPSGCSGDSGGPAVVNGELYGVLSGAIMNKGVCLRNTPGLYMSVPEFGPWIRAIIDLDT